MRNVCYAKPVSGGYLIIGFNVPAYSTPTLPTNCSRSGQPVILLESAHNFVHEIVNRANVIVESFNAKLKSLWAETTQDLKAAREDWNETAAGTDNKETVEMLAQYLGYMAAGQELQALSGEQSRNFERIGQIVDSVCNRKFGDEAVRAGFEIPRIRRASQVTLQTLLNYVFGHTTGINSVQVDEEESGKMAAAEASVGANV